MPRLTDAPYLNQRQRLIEDWRGGGGLTSLLPGGDQLTPHHYYRPAEHLSGHEALTHRRKVGKETPSLPQRAGKIYSTFVKLAAERQAFLEKRLAANEHVPARPKHQRQPRGQVRARVLMRSTPDYKLLAQALLDHAREQEAKRITGQDADAS